MKTYDEQYYFILMLDDEGLPVLRPDLDTGRRHYRRKLPQAGSKPFFFDNGYAEDQYTKDIPIPETPPDVLIGGNDILVRSFIREKLLDIETPGFFIFPSVYIHNDDEWHEDYWYLGFLEEFDCWDREESEFIPDNIDGSSHTVTKYHLNKEVLDKTPLNERLIFKMGGTSDGYIVCHQSLVRYFHGGEDSELGVLFQKVSEY